MKKGLKFTAWLLGLSAVVLLLLNPLGRFLLNSTLKALSHNFKGTLEVQKISLGWGTLQLENIRLSDEERKTVLEIKNARLKYSFWQFLKSRDFSAGISEVLISGTFLNLRLDKKGVLNLARIFPPPEKQKGRNKPYRLPRYLRLENSRVTFLDEKIPQLNYDFVIPALDCREGNLQGEVREGPTRFKLTGLYEEKTAFWHLQIAAPRFNIPYYLGRIVPQLKDCRGGGNNFSCRVDYDSLNPEADALTYQGALEVNFLNFRFPGYRYPLSGLRGTLYFVPGLVWTPEFSGALGPGNFVFKGRMLGTSPLFFNGELKLAGLDLGGVEKFPLAGSLSGDFYLRGSDLDPLVFGNFSLPGLKAQGRNWGEVEGAFQLNSGLLELSRLEARLPRGNLSARGWVALNKEPCASLAIEARDFPLEDLAPQLQGRADFNGFVLGGLSRPWIIGKSKGRDLEVAGSQLGDFQAGILGNQNELLIPGGVVTRSPGQFLAGCGQIDLRKKTLRAGLQAGDFPFSYRLDQERTLNLRLNLESAFCGSWEAPEVLALVSGDDIRLGGLEADKFRGMVSSHDGVQTLFSSFVPRGGKTSYLNAGKAGDFVALCAGIYDPDLTPLLSGFPKQSRIDLSLMGAGNYLLTADLKAGEESVKAGALWDPQRDNLPALGFLSFANWRPERWMPKKIKVKGSWSGEALLLKNLGTLFSGKVSQGGVLGLPVSSFRGRLEGKPEAFSLSDGFVDSGSGLVWGEGRVDGKKKVFDLKTWSHSFPLTAQVENLDLSGFHCDLKGLRQTLISQQVAAYADFTAALSGNFSGLKSRGKLRIYDGAWGFEPLKGRLAWDYDPEKLRIREFGLLYGSGGYWGRGALGLKKQDLDFRIFFRNSQLGDLLAFTPLNGLDIVGRVTGDLKLTGDVPNPLLTGKIRLEDGSVAGQPVDFLTASFNSQNRELSLSEFYARLGSGDIWGSGKIKPDRTLSFTLAAQDFPLDQLTGLEKVFGEIGGRGDFALSAKGSRENPAVTFDFNLKDLTLRGYPVELARGSAGWQNNRFSLTGLEFSQEGKLTQLSGEMTVPKTGWPKTRREWRRMPLTLKAETQGLRLENLCGIMDARFKDKLSGTLKGSLNFSRNTENPEFYADLAIPKGQVGEIAFTDFACRMQYQPPAVTVEKLGFSTPQGSVDCRGKLDPQRHLDLQLTARKFPLGEFLNLWDLPFKTEGVLDLDLNVQNRLRDPDLNCNFKITQGKLADYPFDSLSGDFTRKDQQFNIRQIVLREGKHAAVFKGVLPLSWVSGKLEGAEPMDLHLNYSQDDLSLLSIFLPVYQSSSGQVNLDVRAQGTFPQVDLSGGLSVVNGTLKLTPMENPVNNLNISLQLKGNQLQVADFSGKLGGGQFWMEKDSRVLLNGFLPAEYHMGLELDNLGIDYAKYFQGSCSGRINLETADKKHILYGKLTPTGTVSLPSDLLKEKNNPFIFPAFMEDFVLNLDLDLSRQVWLQFAGSNLYTTGDLSLGGSPDDLSLAGEVKLLRGSLVLPFMERSFNLYRGTASFYQGGGFIPYLENVEGQTTVGSYEIYMVFNGHLTGKNYTLDLFSNPALTKSQIMSLLLTGAFNTLAGQSNSSLVYNNSSLGGISNQAVPSIFGLVQSTLIPGFTNAIGKALSLSELNISKANNGVWNFYISKALDRYEKFLLVYAQYLSTTQQIIKMWGLEYVLPKDMRLRVTQDNYGDVNWWWQWVSRFR